LRVLPDKFGHIDVVVNNAGLMPLQVALKVAEWNQMIDANIRFTALPPPFPPFASSNPAASESMLDRRHTVFPTAAVYCANRACSLGDSRGLTGIEGHLGHDHLCPEIPNLNFHQHDQRCSSSAVGGVLASRLALADVIVAIAFAIGLRCRCE